MAHYPETYVHDRIYLLSTAINLLLTIDQEKQMTHRERNQFNAVIKKLVDEIHELTKPIADTPDFPF